MAGNVPIRESVGAAFGYVRENIAFIATVSAAGAAGAALIGAIALVGPQVVFVTTIASTLLQTFAYAALVGAALFGARAVPARLVSDGMRVWAAMAIIGFLLFIVMFVASMVASIVLVAGPLAPFLPDLQAAGEDQAAVLAVMLRFAEQNPGALLALTLFFGGVWILLTSRFYLAAPASVDQQRILTFETWPWTKGAMLRITGARLLLLIPANLFAFAVTHLFGRLLGINSLDMASIAAAAAGNPAAYLAFAFVSSLLTFAIYTSLEAGLSTYLYRGLKPAGPPA